LIYTARPTQNNEKVGLQRVEMMERLKEGIDKRDVNIPCAQDLTNRAGTVRD
jgi:hypothetical protein